MRWPFGPPHLTLKPSKKNKTQKNKKKQNKKKTQKKPQKITKTKKERKSKKHKNTKKELFSYQSKFSFLTRYPKIAFFDTLAQKTRTQKHSKNRGFSLFFWKKVMRHETAIFRQKQPKFRNSSYHFCSCLFSLSKTKTQKSAETPIFIVF